MSDRAFDPIASDPFSQFNPNADKLNYEPAPIAKTTQPAKPPADADPFATLDLNAKEVNYATDQNQTSATGAFVRGAERGVLPALGSFPAIGVGATGGAALGTAILPGPGTVIGGIGGGIVAGLGASYAISTAQNWALSKLPETWREAIGQDDRQQQLDEKEHATASFLGGLLPYALTMRPGAVSKVPLPENATAMQRIMAHPASARVFGGAVMGGMELGTEAIHEGPVNWSHVAIATGFGVVFNKPTRIGERLTEIGAKPTRALLGEKEPVAGAVEPPPPETAPAAAPAAAEAIPAGEPAPPRYGVDLFIPHAEERPLTVADANDLGVMGPGVTQATFEGGHRRADQASQTAAETKRAEQMALGPDAPVDVHHAARTMHPELFAEYEHLKEQQRAYRAWIDENPSAENAARHLATTNKELANLEPEVAAAYRRAAEAHGAPIHEEPVVAETAPAPGPIEAAPADGGVAEAPPARTIEQQRDFIRGDVEKDLIAAGRPKEEAQAAAALITARYEARAARFGGKLGTAEELYRAEHAEILGPGMRTEQARPWKPRAPAQRETISLLQFIAQRGGIKADDPLASDVRSTLGRDNKLIPGFGPLLRKTGIPLDRLREAAVEAGYLPPHSEQNPSTVRSLIDAIHEEEKGRTVYKRGEELAGQQEDRESHLHAIEEELNQGLRDVSIDPNAVADNVRTRAVEIMDKEHERDPVKAYERAEAEEGLFQKDAAPVFYSAVVKAIDEMPEGKAATGKEWWDKLWEPATTKKVGIRDANNKPTGEFKEVEIPAHPVLPGVKPEEMQWLGLESWLKGQQGSVSKKDISDYVRANQIEVREVEKGGPSAKVEWTSTGSGEWEGSDGYRMTSEGGDFITYSPGGRAISRNNSLEHARDLHQQARDNSVGGTLGTKFSQYTLPGGENYRELLLTLPSREASKYHLISDIYPRRVLATFPDREAAFNHYQTLPHEERLQSYIEPAKPGPEFKSGHFDEPNILSHIRFNDRVIDGKKTLFIEEVQSDWHQKGKRQGYLQPISAQDRPAAIEKLHALESQLNDIGLVNRDTSEYQALEAQIGDLRGKITGNTGVPDAPFKTTWPELALKRMIRYAAEHGYEKVAWTPGEVQAARYDLSKQVKEIQYYKEGDEYVLAVMDHKGNEVGLPNHGKMTLDQIENTVGKEVAEKIKNGEGKQYRGHQDKVLEGLDLKVGGEGMRGFYDKILPAAANKLGKKFGAKVGEGELKSIDQTDRDVPFTVRDRDGVVIETDIYDENRAAERAQEIGGTYGFDQTAGETKTDKVHTLDITHDLRSAATEQGFPLFQGARGKIALLEGRRPIITLMKDANASTFIHETGHEWLEQMRRDATHEAAPESVKTDAATIDRWLGIEPGTENVPTKAHEKFARGFEQYLREGVAPSAELASVFARFKQWLTQIYQTLKGLGQPINDDIKQVFDRMLSAEPQRTVIAPERAQRPTLSDIHLADAAEAAPHEADAIRDRVYAEKQHYLDNIPEDIRREHESALEATAKLEAEGYQPGQEPIQGEPGAAAAEPAGQAPAGTGGRSELVEPRDEPEPVAAGGAGGAEHGAVEPGGTGAEREGAAVREPEQRPGGGEESQPVPLAASPAADFNAAGSTFNIGKDGNIRTENITSVPQLMQAIEESKDRIGGGGRLTMGQMLDTVERIGLQPKDLDESRLAAMFGGATDLAPKIMALRQAIETQTHTVHDLARQVRDGGSDMVVAEFVKESARFDMMMSVLSSVTTETGRALGMAFRNLDNLKGSKDLQQLIQDNTGRTLFQHRLTANLAAALDTPAKVSKFLVDSNKRSFGKMILEYWINGLLSGPATHSTNIIGNAILAVQHSAIETPLAVGIGAIRKGLGREGETIHIGEIGARGRALVQSLPSALKAGAESFRATQSVLLPGEEARPLPYSTVPDLAAHPVLNENVTYQSLMGDAFGAVQGLRDGIVAMGELVKAGGVEGAPLVGAQYSLSGAIPDIAVRGVNVLPVGTIARLPGRFLSAADSFQRVLNFAMAKNAMAYRVASEEGHAGTAFASRVAEVRDNPNESQMERLVHEASELTLMNKGGKLLQALQHIAGVEADLPGLGPTPLFKFVTPFVHVAGNIIKQSLVQRTALGVLSPEIRADLMGRNGTVAQDMASARMLFGTALAVTLGTLAAQDYASGSGPTDPNEAAMWRLAGNQAHSVRIGDLWYGVQKLGPLGLLMGLSADLYDISKHATEGELTEATASLVHAFSQNVLDQSMMKGPAELLKAIQDSDRYGDAYVRNLVAGFVPMSVGMAQIARTQDPYTRQTRTVIDAIRNKIPGHLDSYFPDGLFPKRDIWGEPMLAPEAIGGPLATGIQMKRISTDPVNLAMIELDIHPGKVGREIRNVELTDQQYDDYARIAGRMMKMRLDTIVKSADWRTWPNHIKTAVIQETIRQSREAARGMTMMRYPQIVKDATEERRKKFQD